MPNLATISSLRCASHRLNKSPSRLPTPCIPPPPSPPPFPHSISARAHTPHTEPSSAPSRKPYQILYPSQLRPRPGTHDALAALQGWKGSVETGLETGNRPVLDAVVRRGGREEQIGNLLWIGRYIVEFVLVGAPDGVREVECIANDTHSLVGIVKELGNSNVDVLALLSSGLKTGSDGHRSAIEIVSQG